MISRRRLHVLIVPSEHFVTPESPLAGIFQLDQARALVQAGHRVGVLSTGFISPRFVFRKYPYRRRESLEGLAVLRRYERLYAPAAIYSFASLRQKALVLFRAAFASYIAEHGRPDLVHAHNLLYAGILAENAKRDYGVPYVITEHSSAFARDSVPSRLDMALRSTCRNAGGLACVSRAFKELLDRRMVANFSVVPNVISADFFGKTSSKARECGSPFVFLNVAALDSNKNQSILIQAFAENFRGKAYRLLLAGDGPCRRSLEASVSALGVTGQVEFLGQVARNQVPGLMRDVHCLAVSSNYETFGVVLVEALACGLPLIATRCGGPEDIVNSRNGILVDADSVEQLGAAMINVAERYADYDAAHLRKEAFDRFGPEAFVRRIERVYFAALAREQRHLA